MTVPYTFANQSGNISLSELDVNFANVKSAADTAATVTAGAQPNITSVGTLTSLNVNSAVSAGGNVTGAYIHGDGSQLTNLPGTSYGNANVSAYLASGAVTSNIQTTGNVTGTYILGNGSQLTGLPATYANTNVAAYLSSGTVTSNITTTGNLIGATVIVTTSSDFNNNVISNVAAPIAGSDVATKTYVDSTVSAGGFDITDGVTTENVNSDDTILFSGDTNISVAVDAVSGTESSVTVLLNDTISVVGNISGAYILGNGSQLTGLPETYANANVASYLSSGTVSTDIKTTAAISATGNVTGANINGTHYGSGAGLTDITGANITGVVASAATAGTVTTAAQPNITSVGTLTALNVNGAVSASGNVTAANVNTTQVQGATVTITSSGAITLDASSDINASASKIINLANPVNDSDAATKSYVDMSAQGLSIRDAVYAATVGTLDAASGGTVTYNNGTAGVGATLTTSGTYSTIDGVSIATVGRRVLVKDQASALENGIYTYTNSTTLTRATDMDQSAEVVIGTYTFTEQGLQNNNSSWVVTSDVTTIGTDPVDWTQFSGAGTYTAGVGLTLVGTEFNVNASQTQVTAVGTLTSGTWNAATVGVAYGGTGVTSSTGTGSVVLSASPTFTGTVNAAAISASGAVTADSFSGSGASLTALNASNLSSGTVPDARISGAYSGITTLGATTVNATTLSASGNVTGANITGTHYGSGASLTALNATQLTSGTIPDARISGAYSGITTLSATTLSATGNVTGANITGTHYGSGAALTDLNGSNISSGTIAAARVATLNQNTTGYAATVSGAAQANITSVGTLNNLNVNGTISTNGNITGAYINANGSLLTALNAGNLSSGTVPNARISGAYSNFTTLTATTLSATGNVIGGNVTTAGLVSATGNVIGAYFIGDGSQLTNLPVTSYANANVASYLSSGTVSTDIKTTAAISATGNVTGGNVTGGNVSATNLSGTTVSGGGITLSGNTISSTGSTLTIDPAAAGSTGNVIIAGNLAVQGTTTTYESTTVTINDLLFTVANNAPTASAANGGGIEVGPAGASYASWIYDQPGSRWSTAIGINAAGTVTGSSFSGAGTGLTGTATLLTVGSATTAGTVTTAAQPNITSVGTLTGLNVSGAVSAAGNVTGVFIKGDGSQLTNLPVTSYANANVASYLSSGTVSTDIKTTAAISATGNVTGGNITGTHYGSGAALTDLNASNLSSGTIPDARISGAYSGITTLGVTTLNATVVSASGNVTGANFLTGGLISATGNITGGNITGTHYGLGAGITSLNASNLSTGTVPSSRISGAYSGITTLGVNTLNASTSISCAGTVTGTSFVGVATSAQYADIAEKYVADSQYEPGTVLEFGGNNEVTVASINSARIAGVVSTKPAYLMNSELGGENIVALALLGRVPVKVTGIVKKGDMLVSAGNGFAQAKQNPETGTIIGKAVQDSTGENVIEVVVGRL